jgi:hypothetical protein
MMLIAGTVLSIAAWMAFIWIVDPDGFRTRGRRDKGLERRTKVSEDVAAS